MFSSEGKSYKQKFLAFNITKDPTTVLYLASGIDRIHD